MFSFDKGEPGNMLESIVEGRDVSNSYLQQFEYWLDETVQKQEKQRGKSNTVVPAALNRVMHVITCKTIRTQPI